MTYTSHMIRPTRQAQIEGIKQFPVKSIMSNKVTVVAQHIALVRIDVEPYGGGPRRTALNLGQGGTASDIDKLVEALQAAKAVLAEQQAYLAKATAAGAI